MIDGIFFRTRTGCPWRDLPERFGNWKTVYNRHRRWSGDGTREMILDRLRRGCDETEDLAPSPGFAEGHALADYDAPIPATDPLGDQPRVSPAACSHAK